MAAMTQKAKVWRQTNWPDKLWFHEPPPASSEDRKCVQRQGQILVVRDGIAVCQLYDFIVGAEAHIELVPVDTMTTECWRFYRTDDEMREAHDLITRYGWPVARYGA
jgi:hypothetical protein